MMGSMEDEPVHKHGALSKVYKKIGQVFQSLLDRWTPHTGVRWTFTAVLLVSFGVRISIAQGWYIVTYALAIYHLNLLIGFLTPRLDPSLEMGNDDGDEPGLPTRSSDEFRPFLRRLPEFKFWYSVTKTTIVAFVCTWFEVFNIPVFWPILVMYFITLFCITMKRQIKHMVRYRYIPLTWGKPKYMAANGTGSSM